MGAIASIKIGVLAISGALIFSLGIGITSAFLLPRIDVQRLKYEKEVVTSKNLQSELDEQNKKVLALSKESEDLTRTTKEAVEKAKKKQVSAEQRVGVLIAEKAPTADICSDASYRIDEELLK